MASRGARAVGVLAFLALAGIAHGPLLEAGFSATDLAVRVDVARALEAGSLGDRLRALHAVHGARGHLLPGLVQALGLALGGPEPAWLARLLNLLLALIGALGLTLFLRRLLAPWVGREAARAAGGAALLLFALHPASSGWLGHISARGDLFALALGLPAAWVFLRGRQERRPGHAFVAAALAAAAGFASPLAFVLPLVLAVAEFASARRWRPERVRWRTAATTLVVFSALVSVQIALRSLLFGGLDPRAEDVRWLELTQVAELPTAATQVLERVGVLVLPALTPAMGLFGFTLAGAFLLAALVPGLQAARSAPRLWGWQVFGWLVALLGSELVAVAARVTTSDFSRADTLLGSATVVAAGLAVAATSLSGSPRRFLPWVGGVLFAVLSHAVAGAWRDATHDLGRFVSELQDARETYGREARLFVLDPPGPRRGIDVQGDDLPACFDPLVTGRARDPSPARVRSLSSAAFLAWAREDGLVGPRAHPWLVSFPARLVSPEARGRWSVLLPAPEPSGRPRRWSREGRSPALDLDPRQERVLTVRAAAGSDTSRPPVVHWRADASLAELREGSLQGVWLDVNEPPLAVFDLSSSLAWLLAGRVRQLFPLSGWGLIEDAELSQRASQPAEEFLPTVRGGDWSFRRPDPAVATGLEGTWRVELLDLSRLTRVELPVQVRADSLRVPGAARTVARWLRRGGGPVAWSLERELAGVVVERARGRRVARRSGGR